MSVAIADGSGRARRVCYTPLPASLVRRRGECRLFIVKDHDGKSLAYVYFEDEPGRRSAAKLLTKDEARRIAANIAKLPGGVLRQS